MLREVVFFQIVCDDCGALAGPPQETVEGALGDAVGEDFQNYGPGDGTGSDAVWRCPDCALVYEKSLGFEMYAAEQFPTDDEDLPF